MIRGAVNGQREAVVPVRVRGPSGAEMDVEAVLDTGYTGALTLPPDAVAALGLPFRAALTLRLGDGTLQQSDTYDAEVEWNGAWLAVVVTEVNTAPLIGMRLLAGHEAYIEVVPGGVVDVTPIP